MKRSGTLVHDMSQESGTNSWMAQATENPILRGFLIFAAFRAVYGMGILVVTYFLATSGEAPWWTSIIFLGFSMVFSRVLFRALKRRWPNVFHKEPRTNLEGNE